ncbi:antibiotic biosynthesis monooxygenase [Cryobacterium frigoriphilum]|uniref:Antibiotic biosynthesis monooxygenase n=1 Tax=Cryobacterium frigoriphilum TaxID=1259150 RepID=A0A4R8ZTE9_9MICO|nr:putative quinol monooxygenase [Cryobacterium frigoriphilum]TFD44749.1 antibiotic biosynthesis monooxygenase [Cryobacterium frigoriphilum]
MSVVCHAVWTAKAGSENLVRDAVRQLAIASRAEPGNLVYQPYIDPDEPSVVRIFEVYTDAAAFAEHGRSDHFVQHALRTAAPELEYRERDFYETLDVPQHQDEASTAW